MRINLCVPFLLDTKSIQALFKVSYCCFELSNFKLRLGSRLIMKLLPIYGLATLIFSVNAQNCDAQTSTVTVGTCGCSNTFKIGSALQLVASAAQLLFDGAELLTFSPIFIVNGVSQAISTSTGLFEPLTCLTWDQARETVEHTSSLIGLLNSYLGSRKSDSGLVSTVTSLGGVLTSYIKTISDRLQDHYDCVQRGSVNQVNQQIDQTNQQLGSMSVSPLPYVTANMTNNNQGDYGGFSGNLPATTVCYIYRPQPTATTAFNEYPSQYSYQYGYYPYYNMPYSQYPYSYPQSYAIYGYSPQYGYAPQYNGYTNNEAYEVQSDASTGSRSTSAKKNRKHRTTSKNTNRKQ